MFHKENTSLSGGKNNKKNKDAPLRKSDKRKLRDSFFSTFRSESTSDYEEERQSKAFMDDVFLNGDILSRKLKLPNVGIVQAYLRTPSSSSDNNDNNEMEELKKMTKWPYHNTTQLLLLSFEGSSTTSKVLLPSLALLSLLPSLLPIITVPSNVSKYLCRGADLMKSGITSFPLDIKKNNGVVAICVQDNPQPFATGFVTEHTCRENVGVGTKAGTKGVGVKIVCCYGDDWWRYSILDNNGMKDDGGGIGGVGKKSIMGGVYDDGGYGNVGFVDGKMVYGLKRVDDEEQQEESGSQEAAVTDAVDSLKISSNENENDSAESPSSEGSNGNNGQLKTDETTKDKDNDDNNKEEEEIDMDELLNQSFYRSLLTLSKADLPMPISTYYSKYLLPSRPPNTTLDMKQTTYKKIGAFLLHQQKEHGIITLKASADGKDKVAFLNGFDKNHVLLRDAKKQRRREEEETSTTDESSSSSSKKKKMAIVTLYLIPSHITTLLQLNQDDVKATNAKSIERRGTGYLTTPECRNILNAYIKNTPTATSPSLIDPYDPEQVLLNGPLCDALFKPTKKQAAAASTKTNYPESVSRKEIQERWISKMEVGYAIVQMPGSVIVDMKRGKPPMVVVEVECRQNKKKFVTRVRGLEEYNINGTNFAIDISKRFACSSTIETEAPPGRPALKKNRVELVFQGHLVEEIKALLLGDEKLSSHGGVKGGCEQYCLPKGCIDVVLRKGAPAKRKK